MKKLLVLFMVCLLFSPVIAHSGEEHTDVDQNNSSSVENQSEDMSGFNQLYPGYRSGAIWVVVEVLFVLGATGLAVRHYFRKSEHGSLKGFIRERVL